MKIYISADLEGVNGVVSPDDVEETGAGYAQACVFMTEEVNAVAAGAFDGGADEVVVCDSHNVAQNLRVDLLDPRIQLIRGHGRRNSMVHGLDESFDGLILLGYHAKFGTAQAVLDHTYDPLTITDLRVNGVSVGEVGFNALYAAEKSVPLLLVTGDQAVAQEAQALCPDALTAVVKHAEGRFCARCLPRAESQKLLHDQSVQAVRRAATCTPMKAPVHPEMTVTFQKTHLAEGALLLPGVSRVSGRTVTCQAADMEEMMGLRQVVFGMCREFDHPLF